MYDVLFGGVIDINRLVGAGCIYLLSGSMWGIVYFLLSVISPGSFDGIVGETWSEQLNEFTYHSFVTLTTLGYGDIVPVAPVARTLKLPGGGTRPDVSDGSRGRPGRYAHRQPAVDFLAEGSDEQLLNPGLAMPLAREGWTRYHRTGGSGIRHVLERFAAEPVTDVSERLLLSLRQKQPTSDM